MALTTLPADSDTQTITDLLTRDGGVILADVIDAATVDTLLGEVMPYIERTPAGGDDFTGRATQRTGALVARSPTCRTLVMHPAIIAAAERFLEPYTDRIILHLTQTINIHPGQGAQTLHRDRLAWGRYLPRSIEPQFNTIWALTDFTEENGATQVVPGSPNWKRGRKAEPHEVCQAAMSRGSVLLYTGSVIHGGGRNEANAARLGLNITYCLAWLRQEENQYLSCPPHIARTLEPALQEMLGYTQGSYALGYYSDPDFDPSAAPDRAHFEISPPERALGRGPRKADDIFSAGPADADVQGDDVTAAADR